VAGSGRRSRPLCRLARARTSRYRRVQRSGAPLKSDRALPMTMT